MTIQPSMIEPLPVQKQIFGVRKESVHDQIHAKQGLGVFAMHFFFR